MKTPLLILLLSSCTKDKCGTCITARYEHSNGVVRNYSQDTSTYCGDQYIDTNQVDILADGWLKITDKECQ